MAFSEPETTFTDDFQRPGARHGKSLSAVSHRTPTVGNALGPRCAGRRLPKSVSMPGDIQAFVRSGAGAARCSAARSALCRSASQSRPLSSQPSPSRANMPPSLFGTTARVARQLGTAATARRSPATRTSSHPTSRFTGQETGRVRVEASTCRGPRVGTRGTRVRPRGPR